MQCILKKSFLLGLRFVVMSRDSSFGLDFSAACHVIEPSTATEGGKRAQELSRTLRIFLHLSNRR